MQPKVRYYWVDNVKVIAIVLVALGHLLQSFVKSGLMADTNVYQEFINIIYTFHVPLFFICSGFLYQRLTKIDSAKAYCKNVLKKFIALGVPYFVFLTATYILKTVFADSVNTENSGIIDSFFINPVAPYWFLFALFFLFIVSPIIKGKFDAIIRIVIAVALYLLINYVDFSFLPGVIHTIFAQISRNLIWFVLGMELAFFSLDKCFKKWFVLLFFAFIVLAVCGIKFGFYSQLCFGILACVGIIFSVGACFKDKQNKVLRFVSKYTMPIFLMHTIFAAGIRAILFKIGVTNVPIQIVCGIIASFVLPVIAGMIMEKIKLDFLYNPTKYIKIK